jgi:hypothetical protein
LFLPAQFANAGEDICDQAKPTEPQLTVSPFRR